MLLVLDLSHIGDSLVLSLLFSASPRFLYEKKIKFKTDLCVLFVLNLKVCLRGLQERLRLLLLRGWSGVAVRIMSIFFNLHRRILLKRWRRAVGGRGDSELVARSTRFKAGLRIDFISLFHRERERIEISFTVVSL